MRVAIDVASQLEAGIDVPAQIQPVDRCSGGGSPAPGRPDARAWHVEVILQPMPVEGLSIEMLERRMLAVEYRWPGCRFLGFTTDAIPGIVARSASPRAANGSQQRENVEGSLLRFPPRSEC